MNWIKYILSFFILLILFSFSRTSVRDDYYLIDYTFLGPVKEATIRTYSQWNKPDEANNDNLTWNDCIKLKYGRDGKMTDYSVCNIYGEEIFTDKIKYDENGHVLERNFNPPVIKDHPLISKTELEYDSLGRRSRLSNFGSDGKSISSVIYFYNDKNKCIERDEYFKDSLPSIKYLYHYDDKGLYIGEEMYSRNHEQFRINQKFKYEYDAHGNELVKRSYLSNDSLAWQINSEYDEKDNVVHSYRYSHISIEGKYDPIGYRDTTALDTYNYKYDKQGNWTEMLISRQGKTGYKSERIIKYYK